MIVLRVFTCIKCSLCLCEIVRKVILWSRVELCQVRNKKYSLKRLFLPFVLSMFVLENQKELWHQIG